jgi:hypothetical protein
MKKVMPELIENHCDTVPLKKAGHLSHLVVCDAGGARFPAVGEVPEEDGHSPVPLLSAEGPPGLAEFHKNLPQTSNLHRNALIKNKIKFSSSIRKFIMELKVHQGSLNFIKTCRKH